MTTLSPPSVMPLAAHGAAREPDCIHVFIRDCAVDLSVGIHESEKRATQPVIVSVELEAPLPHHYQDRSENKLDRVIDYERIYTFIRETLPGMGHAFLLETVADAIVDFCFEDIRVRKVRVRLEKTKVFAFAGGAGIDVVRTRPTAVEPT